MNQVVSKLIFVAGLMVTVEVFRIVYGRAQNHSLTFRGVGE